MTEFETMKGFASTSPEQAEALLRAALGEATAGAAPGRVPLQLRTVRGNDGSWLIACLDPKVHFGPSGKGDWFAWEWPNDSMRYRHFETVEQAVAFVAGILRRQRG